MAQTCLSDHCLADKENLQRLSGRETLAESAGLPWIAGPYDPEI